MNAPEALAPHTSFLAETHEVVNVGRELVDYDLYREDKALVEAVQREGAGWADAALGAFGRLAGSAEYLELGVQANQNPPVLDTHDRFGRRIDLVRYHPAYHQLMRTAIEHGLHASPWTDPRPGAHVARAAQFYLQTQAEAGHCCPVTMTFASVPTLRTTPALAAAWEPKITACRYDPRNVRGGDKAGLTIGMAMTEKQGGSDVRANSTRAWPLGAAAGPGAAYELVGHKYFVSAPMCDAFLTLAQTSRGLTCFLHRDARQHEVAGVPDEAGRGRANLLHRSEGLPQIAVGAEVELAFVHQAHRAHDRCAFAQSAPEVALHRRRQAGELARVEALARRRLRARLQSRHQRLGGTAPARRAEGRERDEGQRQRGADQQCRAHGSRRAGSAPAGHGPRRSLGRRRGIGVICGIGSAAASKRIAALMRCCRLPCAERGQCSLRRRAAKCPCCGPSVKARRAAAAARCRTARLDHEVVSWQTPDCPACSKGNPTRSRMLSVPSCGRCAGKEWLKSRRSRWTSPRPKQPTR